MRTLLATLSGLLLAASAFAAPLTPAQQAAIDSQKKLIAKWAAKRVVIKAVRTQNENGPIPGMDNKAWQALRPGNPIVTVFEKNSAGIWLTRKLNDGKGLYSEVFLNAAKGEKAAFVEKPTSYIHAGTPKFDVPMSGKIWQGEPSMDESSKIYSVQIAVPVLDDGKPIGALVVGIAIDRLPAR